VAALVQVSWLRLVIWKSLAAEVAICGPLRIHKKSRLEKRINRAILAANMGKASVFGVVHRSWAGSASPTRT